MRRPSPRRQTFAERGKDKPLRAPLNRSVSAVRAEGGDKAEQVDAGKR